MAAGLAELGGPVAAQDDDISGVVTSAAGPEAGVWVIAETQDLDTGFRKIVVTDDAGRFLVPDLPEAAYEVWVRGYGLADSEKTPRTPRRWPGAGRRRRPPRRRDAAQIYPANYWYSLLEVPPASDFPGTGPRGNGIGVTMHTQADWIDRLKDGCQLCHQLGNQATREMPMLDLDEFDSAVEAWEYRIRAGRNGPAMAVEINRLGRSRALRLYAEWSDRIAAGELPPVPPRPQGKERNVVLSMWAWGHPRGMVHDEVTTDKRNPTLNANGPVYGVGGAGLVITDPRTHQSVRMDLPTRVEQPRRSNSYQGSSSAVPSLYWGRRTGQSSEPGRSQPDAGWQGASLDHAGGPPERRAHLVRGGVGSPVRAVLSDSASRRVAAAVLLRSGDRRVRADRHLLLHAPPAVCRR